MTASNIETAFPLTPLQQGMLYHSLRHPESSGYWGQCEAELRGPLQDGPFFQAWDRIARRHQAFRTFFAWEGRDRPLQVVREEAELEWEVFDWSSKTGEEQEQLWGDLVSDDWANPRDLDVAPVMRFVLAHLGSGRHKLLWSLHHMLADGWSGNLVLKEVLETYQALRSGSDVSREPPPSFAKFVTWLNSRDAERDERYWRGRLAGLRGATPLPGGRADAPGGHRETVELPLSSDVTQALQEACARMRVTPNTLALASWALVLARHLQDAEDVTFGVTVSERPPEIAGVARSVGLYLSTVPVRARVSDGLVVSDWLMELQGTLADAREHSAGGLADIQGWSELAPGAALVRTLVVYESFPSEVEAPVSGEGLHLGSLSISAPSDLPLALLVYPGPQLKLQLVYDTALYGPDDATRLLRLAAEALQQLTVSDERRLGDIDLLDAATRHLVLDAWSGAENPGPPAHDVLDLFEEKARLAPASAAIREGSSVTTYGALDSAANRLARQIVRKSVDEDGLLGIPSDGGADAIVSVVAALKAGRGYTMLDPRQPDHRLQRLLTHVDRVVSNEGDTRWGEKLIGRVGPLGEPAAKPDVAIDPEDVAYVVWTSGSTGEPKGVVVERRHLARSTAARLAYYEGEPDVNLLMSSLTVDSSVAGLFGTLCTGGCLVLPPHRIEQDLEALVRLMEGASVTATLMLPSLYRTLLEEADVKRLGSLRRVVVAGEACAPSVVALHRRKLPSVELFNEYGPSEATVWATVSDLVGDATPEVTIGRPVPGVRIYVLDAGGRPVPIGAAGEICIGGGTVARGYLGDPELTEERFVPDPFADGGRMYRTGDRGRFLGDGRLEFLGRVDDQIKVRGYRVEPVEVERAIEAHPAVAEAAVALSSPPGSRLLVGFVAPTTSPPSGQDLGAFVRQRLPDHMVPSRFVVVERLPRTTAGKLDRRRLAELTGDDPGTPQPGRTAPRTPSEEALAEIWKDVLGIEDVDVHADFFQLGGDSLLSIRVLSRAGRAGISISPEEFFAGPTISRLAALQGGGAAPAEQGRVAGTFAPTPIQEWFFEKITAGRDHWNQSFLFEAPAELDADVLRRVMETLVHHHDALRLRFSCAADGWRQHLDPQGHVSPVRVVDVTGNPASERVARIESEADAEHRSLDISTGGLFRAVLFAGDDGFRRVLLLAHHLVVDAVSWGIILEDLSTLVDQAMKRSPLRLPPKTASVRAWSEALRQAAAELEAADTVAYWRHAAGRPADGRDGAPVPAHPSRVADAETATLVLDREETEGLLERATRRLDATVEEILLGALVSVWTDRLGSDLRIDVEGHGRDAIPGLDSSRTVGWFTVATPLALSRPQRGVDAAVRAVGTALAGLPGGRATYGLLRHAHPDPAVRDAMGDLPESQLLFNYLSTVEDVLPAGSPFSRAEESTGGARSGDAPRAYPVEVNAMVRRGRLTVNLEYAGAEHGAEEMVDMLDALRVVLLEMAAESPTPPGDFELAGLDEAGLSRVSELLAEIDGA